MGLFSNIFEDLSGGTDLKKAAKKIKKNEEKNIASADAYKTEAEKLYADQLAAQAASKTAARGDVTKAGASQQNALSKALTGQLGALSASDAEQRGLYDPLMDYGMGAIPLMEGGYGESPEASAAFMDRYENSPLYQAQYLASQELAQRGLDRAGAARGGLNSGGLLREAMREGNLLGRKNIMDYYGLLGDRMGIGINATNALSGALGRNTGLRTSAYGDYGSGSSSAYGQTGQNLAGIEGAYSDRGLQSGQLMQQGRTNALATRTGARSAIGGALGAAYTGMGNNKSGFWSGAADLAGQLLGGGGGGGGGGYGSPSMAWPTPLPKF